MKKHLVKTVELLNRRRLVRSNFLTTYLGGSVQNRRKEVGDFAEAKYLALQPHDGNGVPERSYPRTFFRIYGKGLRANRALKAAGIEPVTHPEPGEHFWHQMLIDDILLSIEIACNKNGLVFKDQYQILGTKPLALPCKIEFIFDPPKPAHTSTRPLEPDALFAIGNTYFALEADRGTEPIWRSNLNQTSYLRKFLQYRHILKNKTYITEWGIPNLMVLHISTRQDRSEALLKFLVEDLHGKSESQCFMSVPSLTSTAKAPKPLTTLLTDPYQRAGHPPHVIGKEVDTLGRTS